MKQLRKSLRSVLGVQGDGKTIKTSRVKTGKKFEGTLVLALHKAAVEIDRTNGDCAKRTEFWATVNHFVPHMMRSDRIICKTALWGGVGKGVPGCAPLPDLTLGKCDCSPKDHDDPPKPTPPKPTAAATAGCPAPVGSPPLDLVAAACNV